MKSLCFSQPDDAFLKPKLEPVGLKIQIFIDYYVYWFLIFVYLRAL
jgi:hypothetical protein